MKQTKMKNSMSRLLALAMAVMLCIALAACGNESAAMIDPGPGTAAGENTGNNTITLTTSYDFSYFYPVISPDHGSASDEAYWNANYYDTLVKYDENGEIVGSLAKNWDVSEDGTVYTFHLRDDIFFSDGTPVTAEAVKLSIDSANENLGSYLGSYGHIGVLFTAETTRAIDEKTFEITLSSPYYAALNDLTFVVPYGITNPVAFDGGTDKVYELAVTASYGSGPYMFDSKNGDTYTFVSNPYYWGEKPDVESFNVKIIADNASKILALQSGEIDAIIGGGNIDFDGYTDLTTNPDYSTKISEGVSGSRYFGMRFHEVAVYEYDQSGKVTGSTTLPAGVFADKSVRLAAAYAIDQQSVSTNNMNGLETAAETLFSANVPHCDVPQTEYETDAAKANDLLESAGWTREGDTGVRTRDGESLNIKLTYLQGASSLDNSMLAVKSQLEAVGFGVELSPCPDMMAYYYAGLGGNYDLVLWPTNGGMMDPSSTVSNMAVGAMADPVLGGMEAYFPEGVTIAELDSTSDPTRVEDIYTSILSTLSEECYVIPFTYVVSPAVWNSSVIADYSFFADVSYTAVKNITLAK